MCGASEEDLNAARPLLEIMGANIFHCGGTGAGGGAKLCNNLLLGISMVGVCEAYALGEKMGPYLALVHGHHDCRTLVTCSSQHRFFVLFCVAVWRTCTGLDAKVLASIINTSTGRCWSSDTYNPFPGVLEGVPAANNYAGGFGSALMLKDLGTSLGVGLSFF